MKNRFTLRILALLIALVITLSTFASCDIWGGGVSNTTASQKTDEWENYDSEHSDVNNDGFCDDCQIDVVETIDFYNFNDLHGKFADTDKQPGVDELTTFLQNAKGTFGTILNT